MIKLLCTGKVKEKPLQDLIKQFEKRLSKYTKLQIIELSNGKNLEQEASMFLKYIKVKDFVILMDIEGVQFSSTELSSYIEDAQMKHSNIVFIIGSSNGVHVSIKERSNFKISFSKLTYPNQLFRLLLLEQLYRAFKIINNETYHK